MRQQRRYRLFSLQLPRSIFLLAGPLLLSATTVSAAEGVISKNADPSGKFCHLKFPAVREDTLFSNRPVLKDAREGDLIDFHGPCDHDPLGMEEIRRQQGDVRRERHQRFNSD